MNKAARTAPETGTRARRKPGVRNRKAAGAIAGAIAGEGAADAPAPIPSESVTSIPADAVSTAAVSAAAVSTAAMSAAMISAGLSIDIATDILAKARFWGHRIATAESCTGGMVAVALTDIPGSSDVFDRGFVTYSNEAKRQMLAVQAKTLDAFGAVSPEVAREMAEGALAHSGASLAVSITGIAGPGGSEFKPEGRVCFALARRGQQTKVELLDFGALGRDNLRRLARDHALGLLAQALV
jgi:nicotinamide-nucleotide amidase